jgi:hypothetical protein
MPNSKMLFVLSTVALSSCAYQRAMRVGDQAVTRRDWQAATQAYTDAQAIKATPASQTALATARAEAINAAIVEAVAASDKKDFEAAWKALDLVRQIDPQNAIEPIARQDVRMSMLSQLNAAVAADRNEEAYPLAVRAHALLGSTPDLDPTLEALRIHFENESKRLAGEHKYPEASAAIHLIGQTEPDRALQTQGVEKALEIEWSRHLVATAAAEAAKGNDGLAAVHYARAYELGGRAEDLASARKWAASAGDDVRFTVRFRSYGAPDRAHHVQKAAQDRVLAMPDVAVSATRPALDATLVVRTARCTEVSKDTHATLPYVSGKAPTPNPALAEIEGETTRAKERLVALTANLERVKPVLEGATKAATYFAEEKATATVARDEALAKLEALRTTTTMEPTAVAKDTAKPSNLFKVSRVEPAAPPPPGSPEQEKALHEAQAAFDLTDLEVRTLESDRAPAVATAERIRKDYDALVGEKAATEARLAELAKQKTATPKTVLTDVQATFAYDVQDWTRTCTAPVEATAVTRWTSGLDKHRKTAPAKETTDRSQVGNKKAGLAEDPKAYPLKDAAMIAENDAKSVDELTTWLTAYTNDYYANAVKEAWASNPGGAADVDQMVGLLAGTPTRVDEAASKAFAEHITATYGLQNVALLRPEGASTPAIPVAPPAPNVSLQAQPPLATPLPTPAEIAPPPEAAPPAEAPPAEATTMPPEATTPTTEPKIPQP